uniref:DNA gyrase subunit A n=1 Tax=Sinobaca sp. H24 TaxID=2923376 RepID=UPI0035B1B1FB
RKAAKTVGNVIGNYHPHGDSSVYEAMVRMSQDWKVRNALVQMHGNNGSVDGDPPAAIALYRGTAVGSFCELLRDIEKSTVEYIPNFDDSQEEPVVLPASTRICWLMAPPVSVPVTPPIFLRISSEK